MANRNTQLIKSHQNLQPMHVRTSRTLIVHQSVDDVLFDDGHDVMKLCSTHPKHEENSFLWSAL